MQITIRFEELKEMMELNKFRFDGYVNGYGELIIESMFWEEVPTKLIGEIDKEYYETCLESNDINEIIGMLADTALLPYSNQLDLMVSIEIGKILENMFKNEIKKAII